MPSIWKAAHSISGPELDALRAGSTAPRAPTSRPARGINAYALMDGGRLWLVALVLALVVVVVAMFGAWRTSREPVARYVEAVPTVAAPVAAVPALATSPIPTATPAQLYAVLPTMTLYCDGQRVELTSAKQAAARYAAGCVAAYGWCEPCQIEWQARNP